MAEKEINASEEKAVEQPAEAPAAPEASSTPEKKKPAPKKEAAPSPSTAPVGAAPLVTQDENGGLTSLDELALRFRTPSWMQGALLRLMGWEKGKMVTEGEYGQAVERLSGRKMGGGRL